MMKYQDSFAQLRQHTNVLEINMDNVITEMRLRQGRTTKGLDDFLSKLQERYPQNACALPKLREIILNSRTPEIGFDRLTVGVGGISTTTKCIVNSDVISFEFRLVLYMILHEVCHQMQYTKHGEQIAYKIWTDKIPMEAAIDELLKIENTADRWAIMATKGIFRSCGWKEPMIQPAYKNAPRRMIARLIGDMRTAAKQKRFVNINQVNEYLYNTVRSVTSPKFN